MPREYIDLHIHSSASDGLLSPLEIVEEALKKHLKAIAITDHDTTDGFVEVVEYANQNGLELVAGVELSCMYMDNDVHVLGYLIDYRNPEFVKIIKKFRQERYERGEAMVAKLNELGINIRMDTVAAIAGKGAMGRPHLADALVKEEFVHTYDEAFARYIGYHAPAYVPKMNLNVDHAIDLIHLVGGVAVLAHPGSLRHDEFISDFVEMGLDGIEAYHHLHNRKMVEHYKNIAGKYGIVYTGGSDCHGPRKGKILIGTVKVPYKCLENLKRAAESR